MAAATAPQFKFQTQPTKPKRRRFRETTISSSAAASDFSASPDSHHHHRRLDSPTVVSPDNSWCCPASKPKEMDSAPHFASTVYGGGANGDAAVSPFPSSFSKFNSALTAGLLNPMSPPPSVDKTRSSPTLFEMMANEPDCLSRSQIPSAAAAHRTQISAQDKQALAQQRLSDLLYCRSPGSLFNDSASSDTRLTLSSKDGFVISMNVHRQILVAHSRFFAGKLSDRWSKQQQPRSPNPYVVEISDCDDAELYIETLRLMYCKDLRKKLMREDVSRVLGILKVSAAIGFDAGVLSCLEYLEAAPWAEDEEEKVASLLSELRLEGVGAIEVLKRVSIDVGNVDDDGVNDNEGVLLKLLHVVLEGKDEKARREMKGLVLKMLRENSSQNDLKKESLYSAVDACLQSLRRHLSRPVDVAKIAREADNLHWILEILIDRQIAEDFLKIWVSQPDIAEFHSKVAPIHRFEISRVTARLFVGIGKGQLLASKDDRCKLLRIWLVPFYDDFGWMRRANSKGLDRHLIEDGLSNTILTLPLAWQQEFFMSWFDRFLNATDDCPNIQRGFEVWWRRAFWRRNGEPDRPLPQQMRISTPSIEK